MPAVSVIIPVYRSEATIGRCIRSVQAQTLADIELIAVVDGVVDKSKDILEKLAAEDRRLRVAVQENAGVSAARNRGLEMAEGEYVVFVDSDDTIDADYLASLYAEREHDLVMCGHKYISGGTVTDKRPGDMRLDLGDSGQVAALVANPLIREICGKLYSTAIVRRHGLRLDTTMRLAEDTCFALRYVAHCRTVRLIAHSGYNYFAAPVARKYRMNAADAAHHLHTVLALLDDFERSHAIDRKRLKENYVMLFTGTFMRFVAHIGSHGQFVSEVRTYTHSVPGAVAYPPRVVFRFLESQLILRAPWLGYFIRRTFL